MAKKKKFERVPPVEKRPDGYYQLNISYEADDYWLKYLRLKDKAYAGDEEARIEAERMENNYNVREVEED